VGPYAATSCLEAEERKKLTERVVAANNGQNGLPSVPKPPNPILQYDKCATQVRSQAAQDKWTITLIQQVSFGNLAAGCGFTGPDAPACIGIVGGVNLLNTGVNWAGSKVSVWDGETRCLQGH
jgi:hypothetical protein